MNYVFLKVGSKHKRFLFSEILYAEAFKNYVRIYTLDGLITVHYTLKQIEAVLPTSLFCKIHKSFIVAVDKITEFDCETIYIQKIQLPLSSRFSKKLKSSLNILDAKRGDAQVSIDNSFSEN